MEGPVVFCTSDASVVSRMSVLLSLAVRRGREGGLGLAVDATNVVAQLAEGGTAEQRAGAAWALANLGHDDPALSEAIHRREHPALIDVDAGPGVWGSAARNCPSVCRLAAFFFASPLAVRQWQW